MTQNFVSLVSWPKSNLACW